MELKFGNATLRAVEKKDSELLKFMINSSDIENMTVGWNMPVSSHMQEEWAANYKNSLQCMRWIIDLSNGVTLGMVILSNIDWKNRVAELGYKINIYEKNRIKSDTKDAVYAVIKYAFKELGLHRLDLRILDYNIKSQRLGESMGFEKEGVFHKRTFKNGAWHDEYIYGLLDSVFTDYDDGSAPWQIETYQKGAFQKNIFICSADFQQKVCDMREIGGYIELDKYTLPMLHEDASVALNSASSCLSYIIRAKNIKKLLLPKFMCGSAKTVCDRDNIMTNYYSVGMNFMPKNISLEKEEWLYIVNYYGQLNNSIIAELSSKYRNIIVDNVQAYYQMPLKGIDTLYTCRKFFGVTDGAFLYTDKLINEDLPQDISYSRMNFVLGRYECPASEFYNEYVTNNDFISKEPVKKMSKLTYNLLHGIDYHFVKDRRTENFRYLHEKFKSINQLKLKIPEGGAFMYPLYIDNGAKVRKKLCNDKIYIPLLWPDVSRVCEPSETEYLMAENILPLPVDQRYNIETMRFIVNKVNDYLYN